MKFPYDEVGQYLCWTSDGVEQLYTLGTKLHRLKPNLVLLTALSGIYLKDYVRIICPDSNIFPILAKRGVTHDISGIIEPGIEHATKGLESMISSRGVLQRPVVAIVDQFYFTGKTLQVAEHIAREVMPDANIVACEGYNIYSGPDPSCQLFGLDLSAKDERNMHMKVFKTDRGDLLAAQIASTFRSLAREHLKVISD